jgi:hypothetical protein
MRILVFLTAVTLCHEAHSGATTYANVQLADGTTTETYKTGEEVRLDGVVEAVVIKNGTPTVVGAAGAAARAKAEMGHLHVTGSDSGIKTTYDTDGNQATAHNYGSASASWSDNWTYVLGPSNSVDVTVRGTIHYEIAFLTPYSYPIYNFSKNIGPDVYISTIGGFFDEHDLLANANQVVLGDVTRWRGVIHWERDATLNQGIPWSVGGAFHIAPPSNGNALNLCTANECSIGFIVDGFNTSSIDGIFVRSGPGYTITSDSGALAKIGEDYFYPSASSVPEPHLYSLFIAGLGLIIGNRLKNSTQRIASGPTRRSGGPPTAAAYL